MPLYSFCRQCLHQKVCLSNLFMLGTRFLNSLKKLTPFLFIIYLAPINFNTISTTCGNIHHENHWKKISVSWRDIINFSFKKRFLIKPSLNSKVATDTYTVQFKKILARSKKRILTWKFLRCKFQIIPHLQLNLAKI